MKLAIVVSLLISFTIGGNCLLYEHEAIPSSDDVDSEENILAQHGLIQKIKDKLKKADESPVVMQGIIQKIKDKLKRTDESPVVMQGIIQKIKDKLKKTDESPVVMQGIIQKIKDKLKRTDEIPVVMHGIIQKIKDKLKRTGGEVYQGIQEMKNKFHKRDTSEQSCLKEDANSYLDGILEKAREQIDEPMRLPPRSSFVELTEGRVWGFPTLHRSGPVTVTCSSNNTVEITAKLATDELKARYTWTRTHSKKERTGFVMVKTNDFEADIQLIIERKTDEPNYAQLEKFKIQRFKDVSVEMTGMGLFTWALAEITTMMSGVFQWAIARSVQGPLREALERELREVAIN